MNYKSWIKILIFKFLFLAITAHAIPNVTVEEIYKTHKLNVAKFDLKYKGKTIEIIAKMKRVVSIDEDLNYKQSSRKRWGYLAEFSFDSKKILCFSDDPKNLAYSTPNEISLITGFLSDIDDENMIITYCKATDPKFATIDFDFDNSLQALEKAMECNSDFEQSEIWRKLLEESYIEGEMNDIYWLDDGADKSFRKLKKKLLFFGLEVEYVSGFDVRRVPNQSHATAGPHPTITLFFKSPNLESVAQTLIKKLNLRKYKNFYSSNSKIELPVGNALVLQSMEVLGAGIENKQRRQTVTLSCTFHRRYQKHELKTY